MSKTVEIGPKTLIWFCVIIVAMSFLPWAIDKAKMAILVIGLAIFFSIAIRPLARWIDKIGRKKERKTLSSGVAVGLIIVVVVTAVAVIAPMVINETVKFLSTAPETIQDTVGKWQWLDDIGNNFGVPNLSMQVVTYIKDFSQNLVSNLNSSNIISSVGAVGSVCAAIGLIIVLTILFSTQGPGILDVLWRKMAGKNNKASVEIRRIAGRLAGVIEKYMSGQVLVALLDGVVTGGAVMIITATFGLSVGMAFPMALIAAIFYLIPMFGPVITAVVVSLLLFFSAPGAGLTFLIFYILYEQIENNVIAPKIQGNALNLPSALILVSAITGMYMFGLVGAIISIPIAGIVKVLVEEIPTFRELRRLQKEDSKETV